MTLPGDIRHPYIHALGLRSLNQLYDPLFRLTMRERAFRRRLLEQARLAVGMRVLVLRSFDHGDRAADNLSGRIRELCGGAGFSDVRTTCLFRTVFGTLELIAASKSERLAA